MRRKRSEAKTGKTTQQNHDSDTDEELDCGSEQPFSSVDVLEGTSQKKVLSFPKGRSIMTPSPFGSSESEDESVDDKLLSDEKKIEKKKTTQMAVKNAPLKRVDKTNDGVVNAKKRKNGSSADLEDAVQGSSNSRGRKEKRMKRTNPTPPVNAVHSKKFKANVDHQKEASDDELSTSSPSQFQSSQSQRVPQSQIEGPYPGVIKTLRLQNFMCHSDFTHNFHSNLNFVTGQNGSGKSALLSGILIALGGKAAVTSRTTSLKSLIQKGKNSCRVSVTLLNRNGLRSFGEEITIERSLTISGGGGYRIKSTGGENANNWRQLRKSELDSILVSLNIQIDNPVAILNQEVARSFLRSKDPKVKFKLFYEGTLLSKLETTIEEAQESISATDKILSHHRNTLHGMRKNIEHLKKKYDKLRELEVVKNKFTSLGHEYLWALVIQQENVVEEALESAAKAKKDLILVNKTLENAEKAYANLNEQSLTEQSTSLRAQIKDKKREFEEIRSEMNEVKKMIIQLRAKEKAATSAVSSKQVMIDKITSQIERITAEQQKISNEDASRDKEIRSELDEQRKQLESVLGSIKSDGDNFQLASDQEREKLQGLDNDARKLRSDIESKKRTITVLGSTSNKYAVFGKEMEMLVAKVQANMHSFVKQPRGPLGAMFRVKDPKYSALVESILKNHMHSFVVGHKNDLALMKELVDSIYGVRGSSQRSSRQSGPVPIIPNIIMTQFAEQPYNVSRHSPSHPGAFTILELLDVDNKDHIVTNTLIDMQSIERILLFETNADAARVLKRVETCPKSLKEAHTLEFFKFTPAPKYSARALHEFKHSRFLKSGKGQQHQIAALKSDIKQLEADLKNLEPLRADIQARESSLRQKYQEKMNEVSSTRRQLSDVQNEIKRHANHVAQKTKRFDLTSYQEELNELKEDQQSQMSIRDSATKELEPLYPKLSVLENKRSHVKGEEEKLISKLGALEEQQDQFQTRILEAEKVIRKLKAKQVTYESSKSKLEKDVAAKERELQEKTNTAIAACSERIDTDKTPDDLQREHENLKIRIRETEAQLGDKVQLKAKLCSKKRKYRALYREYVPLRRLLLLIGQVSDSQVNSFELMKTSMARHLECFFKSMAEKRGYKGRLIADMVNQELYYFVCPDGDSALKTLEAIDTQGEATRSGTMTTAEQTKKNKELRRALVEYSLGLSGGERSFATICFIMSLWQVMECPFYMLDEFDVFMDAFNRKTSQRALIGNAKNFPKFQYILFTPLDLSEVPGPEDACVLRLFPPVRRQTGGATSNNAADDVEPPSGTAVPNSSVSPGASDNSVENIDPLDTHEKNRRAKRGGLIQKTQQSRANVRGIVEQ
ncbi:unnamed protein product [Orchesella dallaii]|uniref:RecF/RecN/SMC N-terminal domain-containing protein n=1 Tax=Orchesella dallaii TaxID=48710 RepID=A0ABP1QA91_9HEXA